MATREKVRYLRVPLLELTDAMCRWPSGNPGDDNFGFCGAKKTRGCSYCEEHAEKAFNKAPPFLPKRKIQIRSRRAA